MTDAGTSLASGAPRALRIVPSILAADFMRLGEAVKLAEDGGADRIQVDVMDGRFVPNITVGPQVVEQIRRDSSIFIETHLMIVEPEKFVPDFARAGADLIIVHAEVSPHLYRTIDQIHDAHCKAGVALNPSSHWIDVEEVMDIVDLILVMTVNPGFGGQRFIHSMSRKITAIRRTLNRRGLDVDVEVDGGIDVETAERAGAAGANVFVAGTSVYSVPVGVAAAIRDLRAAATRGSVRAEKMLTRMEA